MSPVVNTRGPIKAFRAHLLVFLSFLPGVMLVPKTQSCSVKNEISGIFARAAK